METAMKATKLRGHKRAVLCCASPRALPYVIASSSEDGSVRLFDLRCKETSSTIELGSDPVASICFNPGNDDILYAASGSTVNCLDLRMASLGKQLQKYTFNSEDINQITLNHKSSFLAAADDSGEVKVVDIHQHCLYKTLRAVHTNICSAVQFHSWRPWEVISGGLDSKIVTWDFSKGRPRKVIDLGDQVTNNADDDWSASQTCNPPFVHALAVPEEKLVGRKDQIIAIARGDGVVDLIDIQFEMDTNAKCKQPPRPQKGYQSKLAKIRNAKEGIASRGRTHGIASRGRTHGMQLHLHAGFGGHTAAASCVAFSRFGEHGKFIISGSNDASVKVWDWARQIETVESGSRSGDPLSLTINNKRKVNWLCTTAQDSENLIVCDTSKVVKAYTIL